MTGVFIAASTAVVAEPVEQVNLSGTDTSPNRYNDFAIDPQTASVTWQFRSDGTVWVFRTQSSDFQFQDGVQWNTGQDAPEGDYWVRFTDNLADPLRDGPPTFGTLNTWQALTSTRSFGHSDNGGFFNYQFSCKVEIATDAAGTSIVATGYYGGNVQGEI